MTALTASSGCKVCTAIGWTEGLVVDIRSPAALADGAYVLAAEADGVEIELTFDLEGGVRTCAGPGDFPCISEVQVGTGRRLIAAIDDSGPEFMAFNLYYVDGDELAGGPEVARLRVFRDREEIGAATFEPEYTREEINGEGCGVATEGRVELMLER